MQRNIQSFIRRSPFALLLLMGIVLLAACGNQAQQQPAASSANTNGNTDTEVTTPQDTNETTPADNSSTAGTGEESTASPETSTGTTNEEGTTKGTTDTSTGDQAEVTHVASGTFSGLADEHSAEIMVDGKPVVYQLTDSIADAASKLKEGSEITFKYTEKPVPNDASTMVRTIVELKSK
ncbi:hypothetical protein [Paenibacillus campi]|uniref:hypothetical protein n=1 Tax=Paenibacillus campi TaxID=3106031 RepID=UPI002AFE2AEA|nr:MULTISPECIES: hypothetical protein [unclassified Paenibacillus]